MIRHPLQSAAGHARPDLVRVADGIAASLRQFSISARRCAADENRNNNDGISDDPRKLTGRQRGAAAVSELIATVEDTVGRVRDLEARPFRPAGNIISKTPSLRGQGQGQGPAIITTPASFKGVQRVVFGRDGAVGDAPERSTNGGARPNIIRGGFRGRGGAGPSFARGGGMRDNGFSKFGSGGGGGARGGRDDRPRRGRGRRRGNDEGGGRGGKRERGKRYQEDDDAEMGTLAHQNAKRYIEEKETGETVVFNPSLSLESLAGWGPGLATSATPFAQGEAVMRQARVLGGGYGFHPTHLDDPNVLRKAYAEGNGVFIPPSEKAQTWMKSVFTSRIYQDGKKLVKPKDLNRPDEVKTAVLEDALLGRYDGPKYADAKDPLGVLASYVKRDGTWNAAAERSLEGKVRSLLGPPAAKQGGAKEATA